jgi:abortive infection bacteriophage resistance protein
MKFLKPPKTYDEQLALLKERGLAIASDEETLRWLRRVNYYRLSAYFISFQEPRPSQVFIPGAKWDRVIDLYIFDCRLRHLFKIAMERIEISFRTTITYELAHEFDARFGPFSYTKREIYAEWFSRPGKNGKPSRFDEFIGKLNKEEKRASEVFVDAYHQKYDEEQYLPIWMATELMSFGTLSQMYGGLNSTTQARIARHYNISHDPLESWMHTLASIRNFTAHNSRLWNRQLRIRPKIPYNFPYKIPSTTDRLYGIAVIIQHCLLMIARGSKWKSDLFKLFDAHPDVPLTEMGFPANWRTHPPWNS